MSDLSFNVNTFNSDQISLFSNTVISEEIKVENDLLVNEDNNINNDNVVDNDDKSKSEPDLISTTQLQRKRRLKSLVPTSTDFNSEENLSEKETKNIITDKTLVKADENIGKF